MPVPSTWTDIAAKHQQPTSGLSHKSGENIGVEVADRHPAHRQGSRQHGYPCQYHCARFNPYLTFSGSTAKSHRFIGDPGTVSEATRGS